ncbi:MAG: urea ABC transporter permease subunit UrtC [Chloroflexota bacterium]
MKAARSITIGAPPARNPSSGIGWIGPLTQWAPLAIVLAILIVAPAFLSEFRMSLLAKFLTYAIVALAIDLVWGYAGMLTLGHGVFFGLGGYAMAMYLKQESSQDNLPDFMSWSGLSTMPVFWEPFAHPWFAIPMAAIIPAALAGGLCYLVVRSRITGVYFSLITQALALIVSILFIGAQPFTGGTNGITNFQTIFGFPLILDETRMGLYYSTIVVFVVAYLLCRWTVTSRFGTLLVALRDDENRVRFFGYDPVRLKVFVFALSAGISGIAGALFTAQVGIISPAMMGIVPSIEMVVWVAVGGRGTLMGAVIGAILVSSAKSGFSEAFPDLWQAVFGAMLVGSVVFLPQGVAGAVKSAILLAQNRLKKA